MQKKTLALLICLVAVGAAAIFMPLRGKASSHSSACCSKSEPVKSENCVVNCEKAAEELAAMAPIKEDTLNADTLQADLIAESFGHMMVKHLQKNPGFALDIAKIIQGMNNEMSGLPSPMSEEAYEMALVQLQESAFKNLADTNLANANAFLEKNAEQAGVVCLEPKLQYQILATGVGAEITSESTPLIHYIGSLIDGTIFGNSYDAEDPISLPIAQTIPGFSKGMAGMKEGEKRRLFIHPDLAYGATGHLPPNSLLIFEVEVIKNELMKPETCESGIQEPDVAAVVETDTTQS